MYNIECAAIILTQEVSVLQIYTLYSRKLFHVMTPTRERSLEKHWILNLLQFDTQYL